MINHSFPSGFFKAVKQRLHLLLSCKQMKVCSLRASALFLSHCLVGSFLSPWLLKERTNLLSFTLIFSSVNRIGVELDSIPFLAAQSPAPSLSFTSLSPPSACLLTSSFTSPTGLLPSPLLPCLLELFDSIPSRMELVNSWTSLPLMILPPSPVQLGKVAGFAESPVGLIIRLPSPSFTQSFTRAERWMMDLLFSFLELTLL